MMIRVTASIFKLPRYFLVVIATLAMIFTVCQWLFKRITLGLMQQKPAFWAL
jgi:hypothetical protein